MRKTLLCLFAAVICIMNLTVAVSAEEFNGSNSWNVEFDGNKMKSNFKSSEMTEEIYQLLPRYHSSSSGNSKFRQQRRKLVYDQ